MTDSARSLVKTKLPGYLFHKPTGQARTRIGGNDFYLGPYGSEESRIRYGEVIARFAGGQKIDPIAGKAKSDADSGPSSGKYCRKCSP